MSSSQSLIASCFLTAVACSGTIADDHGESAEALRPDRARTTPPTVPVGDQEIIAAEQRAREAELERIRTLARQREDARNALFARYSANYCLWLDRDGSADPRIACRDRVETLPSTGCQLAAGPAFPRLRCVSGQSAATLRAIPCVSSVHDNSNSSGCW